MIKQRGATLIEALLFLGLVVSVGLAMMAKHNSHHHQAQLSLAEKNLREVKDAANRFYHEHCRLGFGTTLSSAVLITGGYLESSDYLINPFGTPFTATIQWGVPTRITIQSTVTRNGSPQNWMSMLNATESVGYALQWRWVPASDVGVEHYEHAVYRAMYEPECT